VVRVVNDSEIEAVFAAEGPLAKLLPGYQPRRQQIDMALQVARILHTRRGRLVVEAGTGTGKSFAYLVPALLSEGRVVVATGTRALQDQLVDKDAPIALAAVAALRGERKLTQTIMRMKGRTNYLCKLRFERFTRQGTFGAAGFSDDVLVQITRFAQQTKTGDRAELTQLPDHLPIWAEFDADKDHCLFQQCPVYESCHVVEMRRQAQVASVVVVNHHLLCADQRIRLDSGGFDDGGDRGGVLPTFDALIVDEAHSLADVATDYFGMDTGTEVLARLVGDVRRSADACSGDDRASLMDGADDVDTTATHLFLAIGGGVVRAGKGRAERILFKPSAEVIELSAACHEALKHLSIALDVAANRPLGDIDDPVDAEEAMHTALLASLMRRSERTRAELSFLTGAAAGDPRYVLFVDVGGRHTNITAAPIDVASPLSGTLFAGDAPVILTSATLAVGTDVQPFLFQVGLAVDDAPAAADGDNEVGASSSDEGDSGDEDEEDGAGADVLDVGIYPSPFAHKERAALYAPADMPEPNDSGYVKKFDDEVVFLVALARGGALLLFTSHRAMEEAFVRLAPAFQELQVPMLKQGERPKGVLLDELRSHGRAALFATSSFWEGVDVRGAALRLVIIDRLPFRVPSDPLVRARGEHARSRGKDPFHDVALQEAALALKQGAGRLLRTVDDAGVVAVLDGRLRKRSYGSVFLNALPPMTRVGSRKGLAQFWLRFVEPMLGLPASSTTSSSSSSSSSSSESESESDSTSPSSSEAP